MTYTPTVRAPTGIPAAPLVIVSGLAKSGKSLTAYKLPYSELIHDCWIADFGEGSADEYGDPEVHKVLEWGSSWNDLIDSVEWCCKQKPPAGKMNALILDSGTEVWNGLKDRASKRAKRSDKAKVKLEADPDAEIDVATNLWNDAKGQWNRVINPMKLCGHLVGVVIVRQEIVAEFVNDRPTKNKVVSYQCEKTLQGAATAHIQVDMDHAARLIEVRSKHVSVSAKGTLLTSANPIAEVLAMLSPSNTFAAPEVRTAGDNESDFMELLKKFRENAIGEEMRTFAAKQKKVLGAKAFSADPAWFKAAQNHFDDLVANDDGAPTIDTDHIDPYGDTP